MEGLFGGLGGSAGMGDGISTLSGRPRIDVAILAGFWKGFLQFCSLSLISPRETRLRKGGQFLCRALIRAWFRLNQSTFSTAC